MLCGFSSGVVNKFLTSLDTHETIPVNHTLGLSLSVVSIPEIYACEFLSSMLLNQNGKIFSFSVWFLFEWIFLAGAAFHSWSHCL